MLPKVAPHSGRSRADVGYLRDITKKPHEMKALLLLGLVAIGLNATANASGINVGTPPVSGDVSRFVSRQETGRTDLSSKQLQGLGSWLENHRSGWHGMITEAAATNYASLSSIGCKYVASGLSSGTVDAVSNAATSPIRASEPSRESQRRV